MKRRDPCHPSSTLLRRLNASKERTKSYFEKGLFARIWSVPGHKRHESVTSLYWFLISSIAGVLLAVPVQENIVASVQERKAKLSELNIGFRSGHTTVHHFEIARNLPFRNLGDSSIIDDSLGFEQF